MENVEIKKDEFKAKNVEKKPERIKVKSDKKDATKALFMEQCNERRKRAGHPDAYSAEEIAVYK